MNEQDRNIQAMLSNLRTDITEIVEETDEDKPDAVVGELMAKVDEVIQSVKTGKFPDDAEEKTTTEKVEAALEPLFTELNHYGNEDEVVKAIINYVIRQHRTLQQNFFRTIDAVITACAEAPNDLRNEASVTWCAKVKEMDGDTLYYFPIV